MTGASQGLGLAIAKAYVAAGAEVVICGRDPDALEGAQREARAAGPGRVIAVPADISQLAEARRVVEAAIDAFPQVHILVNNAGVYGPLGPVDEVDWPEWVRAIEINLLGSVLMTRLVLPHFKARRYGKIIQVSGGGAAKPLPRFSAYAASKAAVVRFAETVADEVREHGIDVNAIAPGALNTRLLDQVLEAGPDRVGAQFYERSLRQKAEGGTPLQRSVHLAVFLASAASDGISGRLISAIWDPWPSLPSHLEELRTTDVYTLRRIVPRDRGLAWDVS